MYYLDKINSLKDIFGTDSIILEHERLIVGNKIYPIVDDVIILLDVTQYPESLKRKLKVPGSLQHYKLHDFAEDIQFTFGEEWKKFSEILPDHEKIFLQYFDLIDLDDLKDKRVCDLGCGMGRWSYFLKDKCKELILVDFSEAIFVARRNLKDVNNILFFMCDLKHLPFGADFCDFLFCLGVLHHLPTNALQEVRSLSKFSPTILIYLYYALDNRPIYYRLLLKVVTALRLLVSKIRNNKFRSFFTFFAACLFYLPLIYLGKLLKPIGLSKYVPLYEAYQDKSTKLIRQDVYDRFFTSIEQRFSRKEILSLKDAFREVIISENLPYWHFVCKR